MGKIKRDRLAQQAKRRQADEIARTERAALSETLEERPVPSRQAANPGQPGKGRQQ